MNRFFVAILTVLLLLQTEVASASSKPKNAVTWWGDSLSAGAGGKGISAPSELSKLLNIPVINRGVGGEGSTEIAIRSGAVEMNVKFWSKGITQGLWTTYTVVPDRSLLLQGDNVLGGNVGNCLAILKFQSGSYSMMLFKCKKNYSNQVSKFGIAGLEATNTRYQIIWSGRNNAGDSSTVLNDVTRMIKRMKKVNPKVKIFVLGVINGAGEGIGTGAYSRITSLNESLKSLDATYIDIRDCLISDSLNREKLTPTVQDLEDIESDIIPTQLRSDNIHLNSYGYHSVAVCVRDAIKLSS